MPAAAVTVTVETVLAPVNVDDTSSLHPLRAEWEGPTGSGVGVEQWPPTHAAAELSPSGGGWRCSAASAAWRCGGTHALSLRGLGRSSDLPIFYRYSTPDRQIQRCGALLESSECRDLRRAAASRRASSCCDCDIADVFPIGGGLRLAAGGSWGGCDLSGVEQSQLGLGTVHRYKLTAPFPLAVAARPTAVGPAQSACYIKTVPLQVHSGASEAPCGPDARTHARGVGVATTPPTHGRLPRAGALSSQDVASTNKAKQGSRALASHRRAHDQP